MNSLRILDTGLAPARRNVAMTAALAELHAFGPSVLRRQERRRQDPPPPCGKRLGAGEPSTFDTPQSPPSCSSPIRGEVPPRRPRSSDSRVERPAGDIVRFHRYPVCVLLGAGQDAHRAVDVDYCRHAGIPIVRRVTGGGAVYMSPAMLAWDVVMDRTARGCGLDAVVREVCGGVAAGLSQLGAKARFRPPNDIEAGGRKVSGSSGYAVGRSAVLQGTILLTDETAAMAAALKLPEPALRERTTCLAIEIGSAPSLASVVDVITEGLAEALDCEAVPEHLHQDEIALCEALLRDGIDGDAYVLGHTAAPA